METVEQLVSFHHIQVQLSGGAPWGFTLKGGLEHGEPLIITKIEDGGKAALCKELKVGDELININGSALYGSRQEALILIKGSYRILKVTVRRRSVPLIRPHSWHLAKLSEPPFPPPPPPPDSPPLPPPPPQPAMQLHPGPYTLPWHTTDNSDLSMQWGQLSRPYSSTDQSSSLGSMESLDTPTPTTQPYSDSQNSPVDPTLFNNKRDSAYSSFSASSNTSDYATVPPRPGETCSMDNLLQSLGPACQAYPGGDTSSLRSSSGEVRDGAQLIVHKSRSLTRPRPKPVEVKERPSSCCYEEERRGGDFEIVRNGVGGTQRKMNPPQPPTRKDSFRATRSCPSTVNTRCSSAPVDISGVSSNCDENKPSLNVESGIHNGFSTPERADTTGNFKEGTLDSHCIQRQTKDTERNIRCDTSANKDCNSEPNSDPLSDQVTASLVPITSSHPDFLPAEFSTEVQGLPHTHSQTQHSSTGLHRHSAPEKLLAGQFQLLQFNSDSSSLEPCHLSNPPDSSFSTCSNQLSHSSLQPARKDQNDSHNQMYSPSNKLGGSFCSTSGSVFLEGDGDDGNSSERHEGVGVNGRSLSPIRHHRHWGRSASVPEDPTGSSTQVRLSSNQIQDRDFEPLSAASSMDTLVEEQRAADRDKSGGKIVEDVEGDAGTKKSPSSRNHRRNRRRSERFATNLRNEIQRKKAQLQRSHGPGGLLCSGETVQEEEGPDFCEEGPNSNLPLQERSTKVAFASPVSSQDFQTTAPLEKLNTSSESNHVGLDTQPQSTVYTENTNLSRSIQILDPGMPAFGVGIRVVEEPAPAGKARRWRWTPEHKLQPESGADQQFRVLGEKVLGVTGSRHGVCAFTSSSTSSCSCSSSFSRTEESDILPFADRMKFFEETSKGMSGTNVSSLSSRRQKKHPNNTLETRRQSANTNMVKQKEKEREQAREMEGRAREQEREERLREIERQQEKEKQERELEMERARLREIQQEREQEERVKQWERERERELELEREKVMEKAREMERLNKERDEGLEREREKEREEDTQLVSHQEFYANSGIREKHQDFQHKDNFQPKPQVFSHSQTQSQVLRSAFYPVSTASQPLEIQQPLHQGYTVRSYTPTETHPARQQDTVKVNRKYSLTERDYPSWRWEPRPPESISQYQHYPHQGRWGLRQFDDSSSDRNGYTFAPPSARLLRAMSENDLHFDSSHRWLPSVSVASSQTLCEVEEGAGGVRGGDAANAAKENRKKTPPPPRPPPPKLEQFHRRRASHHTLFSTSSSSAALHSSPPSFETPEGHYSTHSSYIPSLEISRQRSYSLPPERQEVSEGCPRCRCNQSQTQERTFAHTSSPQNQPQLQEHQPFSHFPPNQSQAQFQEQPFTVTPPSPMFSRRTFRPVDPPKREKEGNMRSTYRGQQERVEVLSTQPLPPPPPPETSVSSSFPEIRVSRGPEQDRMSVRQHKQQHSMRPGTEKERPPSSRTHSDTAHLPAVENGGVESYFPVDCEQQQQQLCMNRGFQSVEQHKSHELGTESETTLSPSPAQSLEADLDVPIETDIDDFQEEELPAEDEPITSELPCFALPVTVLETDIDSLPHSEGSPLGRTRAESSSLEEELEARESSRERLSLEELFPQSSEGELGMESWRGAYHSMEHNTDSLDRRSGASSSCSSYYSTSAAKAQLLSRMKDFTDNRERDEDDELTYKTNSPAVEQKQLMESLRKKLAVLREAQRGLQEDIRANSQLGEEVESMVVSACKPNEVDKFRMFIGDLDKVVSLLLSLSGRLLRVEATLDALDPETEHHERPPLLEKKRQLMRQLSEAQDLKDHVDRREQAVSRVLAGCFTPEQHRDYSHFVKMKAALLVEQRQLEDKIRLGEEQLRGLRESLGLGLGLGIGIGMSVGYGHY
uniref:protein Shroom4 n=1 Tax=Monopterus albus TaxID=43700 RepID=UPI0009B35C3F|nr:protein Shroom4 [Monopterus albus]